MIRQLVGCLLLLLLPFQAWGQAAQVTSGDHPDFTRIVVTYSGPVDWKVGRSVDGYELRLPQTGVQYDVSKTFDLIQKQRLAAIWVDPKTNALHLKVACACYAIPFEFRPGTVVIDIRNGTPPQGSAFEQSLDGEDPAPPIAAIDLTSQIATNTTDPAVGDSVPIYDWTAIVKPAVHNSSDPASPIEMIASPKRDLEPLRQSLIEQLSLGASAGIVDMAKPKHSPDALPDDGANPSVAIRSGDEPQLLLRQKGQPDTPMTAKGQACITDDQVDVASWAIQPPTEPAAASAHGEGAPSEKPVAEGHAKAGEGEVPVSIGDPRKDEMDISMQFAPAMANLTGEFDRPEPAAIDRAVRFYLFLGFGAEARDLLHALPIQNADQPIWESIARIADGEPDPNPVFAGMEACDTAAALWAVLADPKVLGVGQVQKSAILRAFSALPTHLRQQFGPTLVDRFLAMQDFGTATALRDAVTRGNSSPSAELELMEAAIEKASGAPGASVARLETAATVSGPSNADATVALILQRAELGQDVSYDQVRTIEEYAKEREGSQDHEKFQKALTLAYAASGDFDNAFKNLANGPDAAGTLWKLLANSGPDSSVLNYAVLEEGQDPPRSAGQSAGLIATRLLRLGLADQAERWLAVSSDPPALLAARISVAKGAPQQALMILGDLKSPAAIQVRLDALQQMGDEAGIAKLFADLGMDQEHWNAVGRTEDWKSLASDGPEVWKKAAATLSDNTAAPAIADALPAGPLAQGKALIDQSTTTRDAITALLQSVKSPAALSQ